MSKVSLIMPCYNSEKYLDAMLESVVGQDYGDVELIAVDDASGDGTRAKLESWKGRFAERGYELIVLSRAENGGAAAAINEGLKVFRGAYVCFPDSDDWLYPEYVSALVRCLEENPEYGWAKCDAEWVYEDAPGKKPEIRRNPKASVTKSAFYDMLFDYAPHTVWMMMVRRDYFEKCVPAMHLYDARPVPQEWQLELPLSYGGDYARVDRVLYRYLIRKSGKDMRSTETYMKEIAYRTLQCETGLETLDAMAMPGEEREKAKRALSLYFLLRKYYLMQRNAMYDDFPGLCGLLQEHMERIFGYELLDEELLRSWFYCMVHLCFDALAERQVYGAAKAHRELSGSIRAHGGYIVYGAGQVASGLVPALKAAFGAPTEVWDVAAGEGAEIFGAPLVKPRFEAFSSEERAAVPVIISLLNEGVSRQVKDTLSSHGYRKIFTLAEADEALRGALEEAMPPRKAGAGT